MTHGFSGLIECATSDVRQAVRDHLALKIDYAGEANREVRMRVIHPHQVAESGVRTYIVAWAGMLEHGGTSGWNASLTRG
jgi:predicted DNA-binding transcriptional regulator YafY